MRVPKMQYYKPRNLAKVRLPGPDGKSRVVYLGPWGSAEAQQGYDALIAEWLQKRRDPNSVNVTLRRLCVLYLKHAAEYYQKDGRETAEVPTIRSALKVLSDVCGAQPVREFSPARLKQVRDRMIATGWTRKSINKQVKRIVRCLKWGVEESLCPSGVALSCSMLMSLKRGRTKALESPTVRAVPAADIGAVEPYVTRQVWGLIQLQLVTGMRPGEARTIRLGDIDHTDEVWEYIPSRHKTQHYDRERRIYIGKRGQEVLTGFLKVDPEAYLFAPADAREEQDAERRASRKSPMTPSQRARSRKVRPTRKAGECYSKDSHARAIARACKAVNDARLKRDGNDTVLMNGWTPHPLRHNFATEIASKLNDEASRVVLDHSSKSTTEIYIDEDIEKARAVIAKIG